MTALFERILNMSIAGGIVVLAVVLARLALKRAPKWTRLVLWGVVGLRLALPFFVESPVSLMPRAAEVDLGSVRAETTVKKGNAPAFTAAPYTSEQAHSSMIPWAPAEVSSAPALTETPASSSAPALTEAPASSTAPAARTEPKKSFDWIGFAACAWAAGAAVMAAYAVISRIVIGKKLATAVRSEGNVYEADSVKTPFLLGIFAPKIYLPFGMDPRSRKMVLMHERAHLKNLDHIIKPVGWALLSLHWFNPLVWLAFALFSKDVELACDERVVKRLDKNERADYSKTLLELSQTRIRISACPLAFGESNIKERVKNVLNYKKPALWVIIAAVLAALAVAVCLLTSPKKKGEEQGGPSALSPTETPGISPGASLTPTATPDPDSPYASFADPIIEKQAHAALNIPEGQRISRNKLSEITVLSIGGELKDLSDLKMMKNLDTLSINDAPGIDLNGLSELPKLKKLSIGGCGMVDMPVLSKLTGLTSLTLYNETVYDFEQVSELKQLKVLHVENCGLQWIDPVSELPRLVELSIRGNYIDDLSPLRVLQRLGFLDISNNDIRDISVLYSLKNLCWVDASWNRIPEEDLKALDELLKGREKPDEEDYEYFPVGVEHAGSYPAERNQYVCWDIDLDSDGVCEHFYVDVKTMQYDFASTAWVEDSGGHLLNEYGMPMFCGPGHVAFRTFAVVNSPEYGTCIMEIQPEFMHEYYGYRLYRVVDGTFTVVYNETFFNFNSEEGADNSFDPAEAENYRQRVMALLESGYILITTDRWGVMTGELYNMDSGERIDASGSDVFAVICSVGSTQMDKVREEVAPKNFIFVDGRLGYDLKVEPYTGGDLG